MLLVLQVYQRGCTLANHVDRAGTHIISAIINVAQQVRRRPAPAKLTRSQDLHIGQDHSCVQIPPLNGKINI